MQGVGLATAWKAMLRRAAIIERSDPAAQCRVHNELSQLEEQPGPSVKACTRLHAYPSARSKRREKAQALVERVIR